MSWNDRVKTGYTITCGDGKSYSPNWLNAQKDIEYNIAEFNFKELPGELVKRGSVKARRFNLDLYFQGDEHLTTAEAFEASSADPKPWTIAHPYYGSLLVQPVGMRFDNTDYNVTHITGTAIETISETPDKATTSAPDKITADKEATDTALADTYVNDVPEPKVSDLKDMISNVSGSYNSALSSIKDAVDVEAFTNAYNQAQAAITNGIINTLGAVTAIQDMLSLPFQFSDSVANRISMLNNMLSYLASTALSANTLAAKKLYENNAGTIISSLIAAAVTGTTGAYGNRGEVLAVVNSILGGFNSYIDNLNLLQSLNGGLLGAYIPNSTAIGKLDSLVNYGVSTLLTVAQTSKQERTVYLEQDSNAVLLAHRFYGLVADDSTIDTFMQSNSIGLNEILQIKKGRKLVYYV